MAFVTSLCSQTSDSESSDDSDDDEGVDLKDSQVLREKYDQLYQESMKISKINQKLGLKNKEVKEELGKVQNEFNDQKGVQKLWMTCFLCKNHLVTSQALAILESHHLSRMEVKSTK
ncbi:hypothetical protein RHGRI_004710 [Rhododendron griersonianum]|uniref:Uncharacterized protein n=1 Tax=Rhododendron griersonianum TaxID=479676 RepID=A0AAV6LAV4_9ERIC|nr:hypothetical protein RHGRI_004710 [Rhododendron griersonianum]